MHFNPRNVQIIQSIIHFPPYMKQAQNVVKGVYFQQITEPVWGRYRSMVKVITPFDSSAD